MIPDFIKTIKGLRLFDRCLLAQIQYLSAKKGYCFAQNDYFADFFEVSTGTVKRSLKKMEDMGVIAMVHSGIRNSESWCARLSEVETSRFDSAAFKYDYPDLYEKYLKRSSYTKLSVKEVMK